MQNYQVSGNDHLGVVIITAESVEKAQEVYHKLADLLLKNTAQIITPKPELELVKTIK